MPAADFLHCLFAKQLGFAVNTCRSAGSVLRAWSVVKFATKNIIGRNVNEQTSHRFHCKRKIPDSLHIQLFGQFIVILGLVDICVSGTVDNRFNLFARNDCHQRIKISNVEFRNIRENIMILSLARHYSHLTAQLAVSACYEYIHFVLM